MDLSDETNSPSSSLKSSNSTITSSKLSVQFGFTGQGNKTSREYKNLWEDLPHCSNFIASCTLEAGVKIYSLGVDSVHSEAYKINPQLCEALLKEW
ncbi:hypothetical protein F8388_003432 [Cannabis sativa]|uniref:Condensin complex subunit 2 n=1 Tax=Cannabis sativa TaxID=3483 RepID=A0A7J6F4W9_CANSA|nr:hypothetical protein F8388_003432 [Cannabis sativa]